MCIVLTEQKLKQQGQFHRLGVEEKAQLQMECQSPEHISLLFQAIIMAAARAVKVPPTGGRGETPGSDGIRVT